MYYAVTITNTPFRPRIVMPSTPARIPVILDTDIGEDIDDLWALCQLLKSPELTPLLITTDTEDTRYRAKIVCKFLELAGRTDIPVGIGAPMPGDRFNKTQAAWVEDYDLAAYPGTLREHGVAALIETIRAAPEPVTLICIGPLTNLRIALEQAPDIAPRCHFVGMHGSILMGLYGVAGQIPENNVVRDCRASQAVFAADWRSMTITPLDSCGIVKLEGERYQAIRACPEPAIAAVIENYRLWRFAGENFAQRSSVLYDTVAIHLAHSHDFLTMETLNLVVDAAGFTRPDPQGRTVNTATGWHDFEGYLDHLTHRLTAPLVPAPTRIRKPPRGACRTTPP
jgi:inosine-uridine nucleoside N-ribohydrolase